MNKKMEGVSYDPHFVDALFEIKKENQNGSKLYKMFIYQYEIYNFLKMKAMISLKNWHKIYWLLI